MNEDVVRKANKVNFQIVAEPGSAVYVAGTFNNWDPAQYKLRDYAKSGTCQVSLLLPPGRHEYKFIVDGEWHVDPDCPNWARNCHGTLNSIVST